MSLTIETLDRLLIERGNSGGENAALLAPGRDSSSYRTLAGQFELVARSLRRIGVKRDDRVLVVLPAGPELTSAFLTIAACARFAPLDPGSGARELDFHLDGGKTRVVVLPAGVDSPVRAAARARGIPVVNLVVRPGSSAGAFDLESEMEVRRELTEPLDWAQPDDVAVVLHTSGTTAEAKAVALTHRNLCSSARNIVGTLKLTPGDRALSIVPLFHTHGLVGVVLSSVMAGAGIICTSGFETNRFFEWLETLQPTWFSAVPTMHQAIVAGAVRLRRPPAGSVLRLMRSTSAPLPVPTLQALEATFGIPVIESYGMTEASQIASNRLPPGLRKPGSVGVATGQDLVVVDRQGKPAAPGQVGEILIRGPNLTRGYEGNPEATGAAFVDGWFHTGDLGCLDTDGYLFIKGRLKEMINRGGEKISPREIDEALIEQPGVSEAVAFATPHPTLGEDVAVAVVARGGFQLSEAGLRESLARLLPAFKVPSRILIVNEIPKGPTGKVQRIGLADRLEQQLATAFAPPEAGLEGMIAATIAQALDRSPVGRHDNFFSIGGDSIAATQVQVRIQESVGFAIPPATIFNHPTVAQLAAEVARIQEIENVGIASKLAGLPNGEATRILDEIESMKA